MLRITKKIYAFALCLVFIGATFFSGVHSQASECEGIKTKFISAEAVGSAYDAHGEGLDPSGYSTISEEEAYERMIAMEAEYPTGTSWTLANTYKWNCGYSAAGCMGFAHMISDAAFGEAKMRTIDNDGSGNMFDKIRVGDVIRVDYNNHSVIVIEKYDDYVVIAEGNMNRQVIWGRTISRESINADCSYIETRYGE